MVSAKRVWFSDFFESFGWRPRRPMPATLAPCDALLATDAEFAAVVANYAKSEELPPADWLIRLELKRPQMHLRSIDRWTQRAKRALDIVCAVSMLVLLAPVMLLVALAVRLTSPGPILFRQIRTGLNLRTSRDRRADRSDSAGDERRQKSNDRRQESCYGRPFVLYKFRTMRIDAERNGAQFATKGDPRVTSIGRFLRKTRLDELPQLWNVLRGEMSLVGPRPERPEFIESLSHEVPNYLLRLGIKPGLTGLAQVLNGYDNDIAGFRRKVALDLLYLQNCCLANDLKILIRTVSVVLTGKGAL
jgi:lipopolysaccharide/colanic/teichoic acid biosynthesis glycosyltransferase